MRTDVIAPGAVIIGAGGFIGRPLSRALSAAHVEVEAYTRERRFARGTELAHPLRNAAVLFYLATSIHPALGERHPEWAAADHWQLGLRELAALESPPTVVLTSSGGTVYDSSAAPPYTERSPTRATSLYGAAKIAMEEELADYAGSIPGVILRLSNVYGPGQRTGKNQGVLAYWLQAAAQGAVLPVVGDPANTRDYVYIDDLTACLDSCTRPSRTGRPGRPRAADTQRRVGHRHVAGRAGPDRPAGGRPRAGRRATALPPDRPVTRVAGLRPGAAGARLAPADAADRRRIRHVARVRRRQRPLPAGTGRAAARRGYPGRHGSSIRIRSGPVTIRVGPRYQIPAVPRTRNARGE